MTMYRIGTKHPVSGNVIIGYDEVGMIAEYDGQPFYITDCCGASAKGSANSRTGVCCRACYREIDPMLDSIPDKP